jgi:hypothetical protein
MKISTTKSRYINLSPNLKGKNMVWDLETMERKNNQASYDYVERNRDVIDAVVGNVLSTVVEQIQIAVKTANLETASALQTIRAKVRKELEEEYMIEENLGVRENDQQK